MTPGDPYEYQRMINCPRGEFIKFDQVPLVFDLAEFELA